MTTDSDQTVVLHYKDDGPSGPCGQCMSVTAPWDRLYTYEGADAERDATAYMRFLAQRRSFAGRRNPRIENYWLDGMEPGPIVPEDER
jgi:hypothetical protein